MIVLDGGVNETEPTLIGDNQIQGCSGAEYRVGQPGIFVAQGRQKVMTISGTTGRAMYEASFDSGNQFVVAHTGDSLSYAAISSAMTATPFDNLPTGTSRAVGAHYANRHYLAFNNCNRRLETTSSGITSFPIGMSRSTLGIGTSLTVGVGSMNAVTGIVYWTTEYDSVRGLESMTGASVSTGVFTGITAVYVFATGVSANPRADTLNWYRSVDGGGFPDGGLIATTPIGTTFIVDQLIQTSSLTVPQYGIVSIGGLDNERDEPPTAMYAIFGPFNDSLLGVTSGEPRNLRFTPAGYADSWPSNYSIPLNTHRNDVFTCGVVLPGAAIAFCNDSVHAIYRLPRDSDSVFAAGEAMEVMTDARGCVSRKGAATFTPPGGSPLVAFVARDGIWALRPGTAPIPLTDIIDFSAHVNINKLYLCTLVDDTDNRQLVFTHWQASDTTYPTGVWYLDYQRWNDDVGMRLTFVNHGPLADATNVVWIDGARRLASIDSRSGNGQVYIEGNQDADDSHLVDTNGSVIFDIHTKEFMPAGPRGAISLGAAAWMHDAGPARIEHRFYFDRRDANPEMKAFKFPQERNADDINLGRTVNSLSLRLSSVGTVSYGVHWFDIEGFEQAPLGGRKGA